MIAIPDYIEKVFRKNQITPRKILRFNDRFLVAQVLYQGKLAIFKIILTEHPYDQNNCIHALHKEVTFLKFAEKYGNNQLKKSLNSILLYCQGQHAWYLKDYLTGTQSSLPNSSWFFKPSFFENYTAVKIKNFYFSLYNLSASIKQSLRSQLNQAILKNYEKLIDWENLIHYYNFHCLPISKEYGEIKKFLGHSQALFNKNQEVLNHFEPYPDHLIFESKNFKIIDWENVNLSDVAHDPVSIWLRAYENKTWQKNFITPFQKFPNFRKLFNLQVVLQAITKTRFFINPVHYYDKQKADQTIKILYYYLKKALNDQLF